MAEIIIDDWTPPPYAITDLTGTAGNILNLLEWTNPQAFFGTLGFVHTHIRYNTIACPSDTSDGYFLTNISGSGKNVHTIHNYIENNNTYCYSLFTLYQHPLFPIIPVSYYFGPYWVGPLIPQSSKQFLTDYNLSFSKLEKNTKLYTRSDKIFTTDLVIWLANGQIQKRAAIINTLRKVKPAHTKIRVFWEPYYTAHTTDVHFSEAVFDSNIFYVSNGSLINKTATIDSSFDGDTTL